jgi:hypothetical protein
MVGFRLSPTITRGLLGIVARFGAAMAWGPFSPGYGVFNDHEAGGANGKYKKRASTGTNQYQR